MSDTPIADRVSAEFNRLRALALEQAQDAHDWQVRALKAEEELSTLKRRLAAAEAAC